MVGTVGGCWYLELVDKERTWLPVNEMSAWIVSGP